MTLSVHEAGSELDRLVAEKVMGWKAKHREGKCDGVRFIRCGACGARGHGNCFGDGSGAIQIECGNHAACCDEAVTPEYSTDIARAWELVEKLGLMVFPHCMRWAACQPEEIAHDRQIDHGEHWIDGNIGFLAYGETAPLAICRAALAVVGHKS